MSRKVSVTLLCDIHNDEVTAATTTIPFGADGRSYEIDVCSEHFDQARAFLDHLIQAGRPTELATSKQRRTRRGSDQYTIPDPAMRLAIRSWAAENGFELPARGRISRVVQEAYAEAMSANEPEELPEPAKRTRRK